MKRITIAAAGALATLAVGAAFAAQSYAFDSDWGGGGLLMASFFGPQARNSATTAPSSVSPLVAQELAVLENQGIAPARAMQALDVQAKVANASLPDRLAAAMGSNYAGLWFENAAAQLDVGVTSPAGRSAAEATVAQAGLAGVVTIVPVRSTMAQLIKTQNAWNGRLADLFAAGAVSTGIEPQHNAVSIRLSSAVSTSRRAALKREAGKAGETYPSQRSRAAGSASGRRQGSAMSSSKASPTATRRSRLGWASARRKPPAREPGNLTKTPHSTVLKWRL